MLTRVSLFPLTRSAYNYTNRRLNRILHWVQNLFISKTHFMGISNFPSPADGGVFPLLVMNTVMSVALVRNKLRSVLRSVGGSAAAVEREYEDEIGYSYSDGEYSGSSRERRVSITRYSGSDSGSGGGAWPQGLDCCVCLCGFESDEEVSELSCKHFFHKECLDKWFGKQHVTCPLCRSST